MIAAPTSRPVPALGEPAAQCSMDLAREGFTPHFGERAGSFPSDAIWGALRALGTELWLDTGILEEARALWTAEFSNLTTNNTLVNKVVQGGLFDDLLPEAARQLRRADPRLDQAALIYELGFVLNCKTALRLVEALDAFVSVELHPAFAEDVPASVAWGQRYFAVCPERFIVKVPMTPAGFLAAEALARQGIPINYTLGFSARQNYLAARFSRTRYVNVFMGRLNAFVADNGLGDGENVGEKATLATQRAILALRAHDPDVPRLIGASMRNASQLHDLAGIDVFTMPTAVAREFHQGMQASPRPLASQVENDPEVTLHPGVDRGAVDLDSLWEIPPPVVTLADRLEQTSTTGWTGEEFAAAARDTGAGALFPRWTESDLAAVAEDGKIPRCERWAAALSEGRVGLDALMSISALYSFVADQQQLDDRIRRFAAEAGVL